MSALSPQTSNGKPVLGGKHVMFCTSDGLVGEGTSSICRRGVCNDTGMPVAIKVYKQKKSSCLLQKFQRQISTLQALQRPLDVSDDTICKQLSATAPENLFMQLIDFSSDSAGVPAADEDDGELYCITELGQYNLQEYIKRRKNDENNMSQACVKSITKSMLLVIAGLHARGYVHLDLKPENLMIFTTSGVSHLKLIDMDGCVQTGSVLSGDDDSLSYSPCYCAPQWAEFLLDMSDEPTIIASTSLDVWSIGMSICELVAQQTVMGSTFQAYRKKGGATSGIQYLKYVRDLEKVTNLKQACQFPWPSCLSEFDPELEDMLLDCLLVGDSTRRLSLAETLNHPYFAEEHDEKSRALYLQSSSPITSFMSRVSSAYSDVSTSASLSGESDDLRKDSMEEGSDSGTASC